MDIELMREDLRKAQVDINFKIKEWDEFLRMKYPDFKMFFEVDIVGTFDGTFPVIIIKAEVK